MRKTLRILFGACLMLSVLTLASFANPSSDKPSVSVKLLKKVEIPNSRRPEIVATDDRVFVVYAGAGGIEDGTFAVKIFDKDMNTEIASKILVPQSATYGRATDSRIASDGEYLYLAYETTVGMMSYLRGAKYRLDDNFEKVADTGLIASTAGSPSDLPFQREFEEGDEKLDDPLPLVGKNSIFIITRYHSSLEKEGNTIYKVYEFTKDLEKIREFDIDLSSIADGCARVAEALYNNGYYYMAVPTTVGEAGPIDVATPSDIVMVKFDTDWNIIESKVVSAEPDDIETYISGFDTDGDYFYLTYAQRKLDGTSHPIMPLKIYDRNFDLILDEKREKVDGLRPSLELKDDRIFMGNNVEMGTPKRGRRTAGQGFPRFKGGHQRMWQEGGRFSPRRGFSKDKHVARNAGRVKAVVYIYEIEWWKNK